MTLQAALEQNREFTAEKTAWSTEQAGNKAAMENEQQRTSLLAVQLASKAHYNIKGFGVFKMAPTKGPKIMV